MDPRKSLQKLTGEIGELLRKLTLSQRITIGALSVLIAIGVIIAVSLGRSESWVPLGAAGDPKAAAALKDILERGGISYRASAGGKGAVEVPADRVDHARWLAAEGGAGVAKDSNLEWLFGEGSFLVTEAQFEKRYGESKKRSIEDAIRWSPSVRNVSIVVKEGPPSIYATARASQDSAAVMIALRPGVETLSRAEAAAIRGLVRGAFRIQPENIELTDDHLKTYSHEDSTVASSEDEERTRKEVQGTVERLLKGSYATSEFVVGVLVELSRQRSQTTQVIYDPAGVAVGEKSSRKESETSTRGGAQPVGVVANVATGGLNDARPVPASDTTSRELKEITNDNRFSEKKEQVDVPAGELKGLSVNVVLDRLAVRRVLQAEEATRLAPKAAADGKAEPEADPSKIVDFTVEGKRGQGNLDQAIEAYRRSQTEFLKNQIPHSSAKVNVSVAMFPRPEARVELAAAATPLGWAAEHWTDLLLGSVVLVGLFFIYRMFRATLPAPLDVPALDETVLREETASGDQEVERLEKEIASAREALQQIQIAPVAAAGKEGEEADELDAASIALMDDVKNLSQFAKETPEVASGVIRMWLTEEK